MTELKINYLEPKAACMLQGYNKLLTNKPYIKDYVKSEYEKDSSFMAWLLEPETEEEKEVFANLTKEQEEKYFNEFTEECWSQSI